MHGAIAPLSLGILSLDDAVRVHRPALVRRLALVVGDVDEAEDLAQQAFLRATERWPFPPEQDVGRWLAVVGLRLAIDEHRRRKRWGFFPIRCDSITLFADGFRWESNHCLRPPSGEP